MTVFTVSAHDSCYAEYGLPVKKVLLNDGSQLAYVEKGKGKVIIFIHGLGGNISHWIKSMQILSKGYRCIAVDLPGYGYSISANKNDSDQLKFYADVITHFSKKLSLKNITVAGHSMGGQVAVIAALAHPELIKQLILIDPAGLETFTETEQALLTNFSTPVFFKNQDEATIRKNFKNNFYHQPADAEKLIQYRLHLTSCSQFDEYTKTLVKGIKGMLSHPVKNSLSTLKQKVLLVFGEDDNLIPNRLLHPSLKMDDIIKVATENIKNIKVEVVPKAGHMLAFEKPDELSQIIKNFLK
jgi:pimeloyl-ACP methyl ester carboxylesterase